MFAGFSILFATFGANLSVNCQSDMPAKRTKTKSGSRGINIRVQKNEGYDSLFLDIVLNGRRTREFLRLYLTGNRDADRETWLLAEQIRTKRARELSLKRIGIEELKLRPEEDFLSFFHSLAEEHGKPWKNVKFHLANYESGHPRFGDIDEQWIDGFRKYLEKRKLAINSIATYLDVLKTAFNIAIKRKIIAVSPFAYAKPTKRVRTNREYLTIEDLRAIQRTKTEHDMVKRSFLFACLTGLRISDLRQLTWKNVNGSELKIAQKKTGDHVSVPISDQARAVLPQRNGVKDTGKVFDFPSRDDVYNRRLQWLVADAGIEKHVTSHVARHTFATLLVSQGNDLYSVQHLLGHRDIKVTQIYAKLVDERKRIAIDSIPLIGDWPEKQME